MPYTKKNNQKRRRGGYRKKRKNYSITSSKTPNFQSPLGNRYLFKTRYYDSAFTLNPVGSLPAGHAFRLNSLYDPDKTGAGHQVWGFDEIMPLYKFYRVIGARIRVDFTNTDTIRSQVVALQVARQDTAVSDVGQLIEMGNCVHAVLAPQGSGGCTKTLTLNFSPKKFFGKEALTEEDFMGTISSNPAREAFAQALVQSADDTDTSAVMCAVTIEYIAVMTEPLLLSQS